MHPLIFPGFDPVLVAIGPFAIRWYALAYIVSLVIGWRLMRGLAQRTPVVASHLEVDDFLTWAVLGVVLGGRAGYVLFYQPGAFLAHPGRILQVWHGGMSFHGGCLGVVAAILLYTRARRIPVLGFADRLAVVTPIGLGLGRCANFINGELWGRPAPSWVPFRMIYPRVDMIPRFPSEIYEALLEGLVLGAVMWWAAGNARLRARFGFLTGLFLAGYGVARFTAEFTRAPDVFLGFLAFGLSMGQILSLPMIALGALFMALARPRAVAEPAPA
jgi:phosphatidylglycerol---prolipoprotein diacylglyceryl transferase